MRSLLLTLCLLLVVSSAMATPSLYDDMLRDKLDTLAPDELVPVVIQLTPRADVEELAPFVEGLDNQARRDLLWDILSDRAEKAQNALLDDLYQAEQNGQAEGIRSLVIANSVYARVHPEVLNQVAAMSNISRIFYSQYEIIAPPVDNRPTDGSVLDEEAPGVVLVRAPEVWAEDIMGEGVLVAVMDTGVDYNHPDLSNLWDGGNDYPYHGYDFESNDNNPMDGYGHGTHCAGTVLGNGTNGTTTGVAPAATLMCLKVLSDWGGGEPYMMWDAMDFALEHNADVTSVSLGWFSAQEDVRRTFRENYDILDLANIFSSVAAGNESGSENSTEDLRTPGNVPGPFIHPTQNNTGGLSGVHTAGATDYNDELAYFSSIGPVTWETIEPWNDWPWNGGQDEGLIKPDLSAPGVDVNSTVIGGGYSDSYSGTSMATPHIAGAAALLYSMWDDFTPAQIAEVLQMSSVDLGSPGKDNFFGAGRLDCYDAMLLGETFMAPVIARLSPEFDPWYFDQNGGTLWFDATIKNNLAQNTPAQAWNEVILPNGTTYPLNVYNIMLQVDVDIEVDNVTLNVPAGAPEGVYEYVVKVGQYPDNVAAMDSFEFVKMSFDPDGDTEFSSSGLGQLQPATAGDAAAARELPGDYALNAAYPNPFNPTTSLNVTLPAAAELNVTVYDVQGRQVATLAQGVRNAGSHTLTLDGSRLSSGVYFVHAMVPGHLNATQKVMLVK